MGSISHRLSRMLGLHGGYGEGRGRTGMFAAGHRGKKSRELAQHPGIRRHSWVPVHMSLALLPGKEKNISGTRQLNLVPLSWEKADRPSRQAGHIRVGTGHSGGREQGVQAASGKAMFQASGAAGPWATGGINSCLFC